MTKYRIESDSIGEVKVPENVLWGAQTQRSLEHFSIGKELIPEEMIHAYGELKKACAKANLENKHLSKEKATLIIQVCNEIIAGKHNTMFPLHVWMTGSGTQFNMNMNEVISNRCCQLAGTPLGSKSPVHPNDDVNMAQSSNDTFPTAMHIAAYYNTLHKLIPSVTTLKDGIHTKANDWKNIIKIGRTHMQDATPLSLQQEWSGYVELLKEHLERINFSLNDVAKLTIGGTAVGTGINTYKCFSKTVINELNHNTTIGFKEAPNKFAYQGSHDALTALSGSFKDLASSLYKIANDIRLLSCGPRAGFNELHIPENEPGSSIMPGKVNPTQAEALAMVCLQVIGNDLSTTMGNASGYMQMNVYKPLMIYNILQSIRILSDACTNFNKFLIAGTQPNKKQITYYVENSLMLVTALSPVVGYDKASEIAHHAFDKELTLKQAALELGYVTEEEFDKIVDPSKMIGPS